MVSLNPEIDGLKLLSVKTLPKYFLVIGSVVLTFAFYLFWWQSTLLYDLDNQFYDQLTHITPSPHTPDSTVIVEIDDKSLKVLGQWPWPRLITAKLIESIAANQPKAVVLDMVFSEKDRTSPSTMESFYRSVLDTSITITGLPEALKDNDAILSNTISHAPVVLPIFSDTQQSKGVCVLPQSVTYDVQLHTATLFPLTNIVCNLPRFQQNAHGIGHIHASADNDGILRRLSLVMRNHEAWIPALGLAAVASLHPGIHFSPAPFFSGDMQLNVDHKVFFLNRYSDAMLSFYPLEQYERISAVDVLNGSINLHHFKGKYVFIGSTALGLDNTYITSDGSVRSGVYVHATMVENILHNDLGVQPSLYRLINIALSFLIGIGILVLMIKKHYISVIVTYFAVIFSDTFITYWAWKGHLYLSLGYMVVPLSSYLFFIALLMFFIHYRNQEKFIHALNLSTYQKEHLRKELTYTESQLEYQKAIVYQQSKLAAMGEMIDTIAHQWKQPLNLLGMIVQHAEVAYAKGKVDESYIHNLSTKSMEQILFMAQTIEDFRNFVKPDRKNIPFDLNQSVEESLRLLSGMFRSHGITITVHYCDKEVIVMGSPSEFKQVIINLLQNARDALLDNNPNNPLIYLHILASKHDATLIVTDNGGGIPAETLEHIFEPYFTTKEEGKGSGVGLYITDAIIRTKMGGTIEASNTNNGAIFTITLPLQ